MGHSPPARRADLLRLDRGVIAVGGLLLMVIPVVWAFAFVVVGLAGCAWLTLAPLTRRKALEKAAQSAAADTRAAAAHLDGLDAASVPKETL